MMKRKSNNKSLRLLRWLQITILPWVVLIADALQQTNYEGIITVEESHTTKHSFDIVEGMEIDAGFASPSFHQPSKVSLSLNLEGVYVHLSKEIITQNDQIVPAMEKALGDQKALLIIAKGIEGEALQTSHHKCSAWSHASLCSYSPTIPL